MYKLEKIKYNAGDFKLSIDSLHLEKGAVYAVLGHNGCGKTTLLNLLAFLIKPQGGKIFFKDRYINRLPQDVLVDTRKQFGYLMQ
ncbi:MAG TPA: ABC transporter ATP-binding protein, partial [Elusimicrobiales bacterium]|nr:ABC transporter ATP-binding protein [Elusimicrobiales bacterium]